MRKVKQRNIIDKYLTKNVNNEHINIQSAGAENMKYTLVKAGLWLRWKNMNNPHNSGNWAGN